MDSNKRIAEIKEFWVPALKMHMEIGWTAPVEELLLKFQPFLANSGNAKLISIFQTASVWLVKAKQKECLEGKDCLLNKEHKYYNIFLQSRDEFIGRKSYQNPGPLPDGSCSVSADPVLMVDL